MSSMIKIDDEEFKVADLSENALKQIASIKFVDQKIEEQNNVLALLTRAKKSYISALKQEMLSSKAGFVLSDE